jgi:hypothetical protein
MKRRHNMLDGRLTKALQVLVRDKGNAFVGYAPVVAVVAVGIAGTALFLQDEINSLVTSIAAAV